MNLRDTETTDASKYRLIGRSVLSYRFIAPHSETLYIGDIKKVVDTTKGATFFAKITDLSHDSNFADPRWDTRAYAEQFYGLGEDVFITVDAVPLGFVDKDGKFHKPRTIPSKFSTVEDSDGQGLPLPHRADGRDRGRPHAERPGRDPGCRRPIPARVLPQHMGIFATTGMGKSNFMKTFCASCMKEKKFGLLIVDPHGEVRQRRQVLERRAHEGARPLHEREGTASPSSRSGAKPTGRSTGMHRLNLEYRRLPDQRPLHPLRAHLRPVPYHRGVLAGGRERGHPVLRDCRPEISRSRMPPPRNPGGKPRVPYSAIRWQARFG